METEKKAERTHHSPLASTIVERSGLLPQEAKWPEFIRLPKSGQRCAITGLSRATLNELILGPRPRVRSAVIRTRGKTRGIRLIETASLLEFVRSNITVNTSVKEGESNE